jgi:hypothetical protein
MSESERKLGALRSLIRKKVSAGLKVSEHWPELRRLLNEHRIRAEGLPSARSGDSLPGTAASPAAGERTPCDTERGCAATKNHGQLYVIQWKCRITGNVGSGSLRLGRLEADRLAAELNRDTMGLEYEAVWCEFLQEPISSHSVST